MTASHTRAAPSSFHFACKTRLSCAVGGAHAPPFYPPSNAGASPQRSICLHAAFSDGRSSGGRAPRWQLHAPLPTPLDHSQPCINTMWSAQLGRHYPWSTPRDVRSTQARSSCSAASPPLRPGQCARRQLDTQPRRGDSACTVCRAVGSSGGLGVQPPEEDLSAYAALVPPWLPDLLPGAKHPLMMRRDPKCVDACEGPVTRSPNTTSHGLSSSTLGWRTFKPLTRRPTWLRCGVSWQTAT